MPVLLELLTEAARIPSMFSRLCIILYYSVALSFRYVFYSIVLQASIGTFDTKKVEAYTEIFLTRRKCEHKLIKQLFDAL
jgi:hypothetical protein